MEAVFGYIIGLGAAVMMPIIFTILGVCIKIKFGKALQSGLYVGVGFVGLSVITALLTSSLSPSLSKVVEIYDLNLEVFDMGWPAAAAVAYNTSVGAFIIPVCLGVNILMLLTKTTKTVNIDLWNYWHFAFIGAMVYYTMDNIAWGFFAAVICYILTLIAADYTAPKFQKFYDKMDGISIPQPFCQGFMPFAILINKALDLIPGFNKLYIDAEGMKKKFGILGEPRISGMRHRRTGLQERAGTGGRHSGHPWTGYQDGSRHGADSPHHGTVHRRPAPHFRRHAPDDCPQIR